MAIIEAIVSGFFAILSAIITTLIKIDKIHVGRKIGKGKRIFCGLLFVTILLTGSLIGLSLYFVHQSVISPQPLVKIIAPSSASAVGTSQNVEGISKNLNSADKVWIVVHEGNLYYPMKTSVDLKTYGSWPSQVTTWTSTATFGNGTNYEIIAVLANPAVQNKIETYLNDSDKANNFPGVSELDLTTLGAVFSDTVSAKHNQNTSANPTSSPSPTPTSSPSPTPTSSPSPTPTSSPSPTPTSSPSPTPTSSPSPTPTSSPSPTPTSSPSPTPTSSPSPTPTPSPSPTPTPSPSPTPTPSPSPTPTPLTEIKIVSPNNNSIVNIWQFVNGTSQNVPSNLRIWIVTHEGSLYYPAVNGVNPTNGNWYYNTTIGKSDDGGKIFTIIVVLVNSQAQAYFDLWTNDFATDNHFDMHLLPSGTTIYNQITVTRQ